MKRLVFVLALVSLLATPVRAYTGNEGPGGGPPDLRPLVVWLVRAFMLRDIDLGVVVIHYGIGGVTATDTRYGQVYP